MMKAKGDPKWYRKRSHHSRSSLKLSLTLFVCLIAVMLEPKGSDALQVDAEIVKKFVTDHEGQFDYDQLRQWFERKAERHTNKTFEYPRAFPFCVTRNQIIQGHKDTLIERVPDGLRDKPQRVKAKDHLFKFHRIFEHLERTKKKFYHFNEQLDSTAYNKSFVRDIVISRINTPELDMVNLRQWVHINVKMTSSMQGLYMQSIVGPFGLPMGEFSVEFPCSDDAENTGDIADVGQLAYCAMRPKTTVYHPSVYVGVKVDTTDLKNPIASLNGKKEFHMHFKWFDLFCMETPYVQFLLIIVKKFDINPVFGVNYVAQVSPVWLNSNYDTRDGAPYPYYPGFKRMFCNVNSQNALQNQLGGRSSKPGADPDYADIHWIESGNVLKIQPNEQYDTCLMFDPEDFELKASDPTWGLKYNRTILDLDEEKYQCGPGPLQCDVDPTLSSQVERAADHRQGMIKNEEELIDCQPCGVPECRVVGFTGEQCGDSLPYIYSLEEETSVLTNLDENTRKRGHGVAAMLAFLFFLPIGNFVGRFYKEVMGKRLFGNGPWIFIHIVCSMLCLAGVWGSMGAMVPSVAQYRLRRRKCRNVTNDDTSSKLFKECMGIYETKTPHNFVGLAAFLLVHVVPIFGFIRPPSSKVRLIMSIIHSHLGYLVYILGITAALLAMGENTCFDTKIFTIILVTLPIVFSIIVVIMDCMSDKNLGIKPARKQWPVLEQLHLEKRGPLEVPKLIVLGIFLFLMSVTWIMALISLHVVAGSGDKLIEGSNAIKGKKANIFKGLQGVFGKCTPDSDSSSNSTS